MISPSQRLLPDNTQHSQQTNIHAPGGIQTHDLSRRAAADLRLRPRGYWNRQQRTYVVIIIQQNATEYSLFKSVNCLTCFGLYFTHRQELITLHLQYITLMRSVLATSRERGPATFTTGSSRPNGLINAIYYRPLFLNHRAAARYRALASIIPGPERYAWN